MITLAIRELSILGAREDAHTTPAQGDRWSVSLGQHELGTMGNQKEQMASGWDRDRSLEEGMKKVTRAGCSAVALGVRAAFISKGSLPMKS